MTVTDETAGAAAGAADPVLDMRPRLRHDVLFADIGDGVVLRNAKGGYVIKGRTAYRFTSSLAPFLTGDLTVAQLCADLTPERSRMIADFVRTLVDRGFARDVRGSRAIDLPDALRDRFAPQVSYVEHYVDDAAERFLRFRTTRALVLGTGPIARAAALGLLRNGMETVSLAGPADAVDELEAQATELRDVGCPAFVRLVDVDPAALTAADLAAYDVVVAPAQDIGTAALLRLSGLVSSLPPREGERQGAAVLPAVLPAAVVGDAIVLGPVVRPGATPCWSCAVLRLGANGEPAAIARLWRDIALPGLGAEQAITPQLSAMVGTMLAFDLFRVTTGALDAETDGAIVAQHVHTLESRREELRAHPLCPHCADHAVTSQPEIDLAAVAAAVPGRPAYEPPDKEGLNALLERFEKLASTRVGLVAELDDMPLQQSPVKASRVVVGSARHPGAPPRRILAFDLHYVPIARREAVHAALLGYVGEIADTRAAVTGSPAGLRAAGHDVVAPHDLVTATGLVQPDADRDATWLAATSLTTGARLLAPAAAVHPFAPIDGGHGFERSAAGDGAGSTLADAVAAGVLSALAYEALVAAASGVPGRALTVAEPPVGSELEFLVRTVANLDLDVELIDLTPDRPARVVLARVAGGEPARPGAVGSPPAGTSAGTPDWHVGVGLDTTSAVVDALLGIVGKEQARRDAAVEPVDPGTVPGSHGGVDLGRPLLADLDPRVVRVDGSAAVIDADADAGRAFATVGDVLRDLAARGQDAFAVPTTTPDIAAHGAVATARVLLRRAR